MRVSELKPRTPFDELELTVTEKSEPRNFTSRFGTTGRVCDAKGVDEHGDKVVLTLWNEQIEKVKVDDKIRIIDGWASEWQGNLQVSSGRKGKIEIL